MDLGRRAWTQRQKLGPGVRPTSSLVFDDKRKRAVLSAVRPDGAIQETWELAEVT